MFTKDYGKIYAIDESSLAAIDLNHLKLVIAKNFVFICKVIIAFSASFSPVPGIAPLGVPFVMPHHPPP